GREGGGRLASVGPGREQAPGSEEDDRARREAGGDERDLELGEEGLGHAGADDERLVGAERGERADQEDEEGLGEVVTDAEGDPEREERADDAPAQLLQVRGEGHAHIVLWPHAAGRWRVR